MTRILAVDTSAAWAGVALVERARAGEHPRVVAELNVVAAADHSARILTWIASVLDVAGWSRASLDGFVATRGPGSFTGLRVGLGTASGLALAAGRPAAGIPTLEAWAEASGPAGADRLPVLAAGRGEVYLARFDRGSSPPAPLEPPRVGRLESLLATAADGGVLVGVEALPAGLDESAGRRFRIRPAPSGVAAAAGRIALLRDVLDRDAERSLAPLYVRPPDAVVKARARRDTR